MQATTNQAMPLADNQATPLADNRALPLADNRATPLAENNSQAARAADTHMAMLLAVYTAQNNTNAKSAAELVGAQSEALDATWGNRATPQQMNGARNLSESFSAAKPSQKQPLSPRVEVMMEQEQNCSQIDSIVLELRKKGETLEDEKRSISLADARNKNLNARKQKLNEKGKKPKARKKRQRNREQNLSASSLACKKQ